MDRSAIFLPFLSVMLLTLVVWVAMYVVRLRYVFINNIQSFDLSTPEKINALIPEKVNNPSNNLKNLFELPVLFYALCLYLYLTNTVDEVFVYTAWVFFVFRALHSFVQCFFNIVALRFCCYMLASFALWFMLMRCILIAMRIY